VKVVENPGKLVVTVDVIVEAGTITVVPGPTIVVPGPITVKGLKSAYAQSEKERADRGRRSFELLMHPFSRTHLEETVKRFKHYRREIARKVTYLLFLDPPLWYLAGSRCFLGLQLWSGHR
jgi:hypothetical protein